MNVVMNVIQLLDELKICDETATVSCILQSEENSTFYDTKCIRTALDNNRVSILVMDMSDVGMTVQRLISELEGYEETLPVVIEENSLKRPHRLFTLLSIENQDNIVLLKIPQKMADITDL